MQPTDAPPFEQFDVDDCQPIASPPRFSSDLLAITNREGRTATFIEVSSDGTMAAVEITSPGQPPVRDLWTAEDRRQFVSAPPLADEADTSPVSPASPVETAEVEVVPLPDATASLRTEIDRLKADLARATALAAERIEEANRLSARAAELERKNRDLRDELTALQAHYETVLDDLDTARAVAPNPQPAIETRILRDTSESELAKHLNAGWGILHMQFVPTPKSGDRLNVVLQREVPAEQPAPGAAEAIRTVTGTIVAAPPASFKSIDEILYSGRPVEEQRQALNQMALERGIASYRAACTVHPVTRNPFVRQAADPATA